MKRGVLGFIAVGLICLLNIFWMDRHQHLEEVLEETKEQLREQQNNINELKLKSSARPDFELLNRTFLSVSRPIDSSHTAHEPPREQGSGSVDALTAKIAELHQRLWAQQNRSSSLALINAKLKETNEDLRGEVQANKQTIAETLSQLQKVQAKVENPASAQPENLHFGKIPIGKEKYTTIREKLQLDEPIVITGSRGPGDCNLFCSTGGGASCPPQCIFREPIVTKGQPASACIFNGHGNMKVPDDIREYGCIPVAEGMESEVNYVGLANHRNDVETWTRTYRRDSDAPAPYYSPQEVRLRHPDATIPLEQRVRGAVAVISNCRTTERKEVIAVLRKHIDVTFLGKCGDGLWPNDCPSRKKNQCSKFDVLTRHVIYLAFENSYTHDYATEKLYDGLSTNSITVSFGAPNSIELAPLDSIINIASVADADAVGVRLKEILAEPSLKEAHRITNWHQNLHWRPQWEEKMAFTRLHSDCRLCAALRRRVVVATGAANASFDQLYHTVASVQKWEHGRGIMVFDMGLTDWQRDQVRAWRDVALVALEEFSRLQHAHWKLRVHALLYAVHAAGKALWLDAGVIVHRRLAVIDVAIERHGVFLVQQAPAIGEHVSATALHDLGLPEAARTNLPLLSTAVQGYADQGLAYERVLLPVAHCVAQDSTCATGPPDSKESSLAYPSDILPDQGVLSAIASTSGLALEAEANAEVVFGKGKEHPAGAMRLLGKDVPQDGVVYAKGACVIQRVDPDVHAEVLYYALNGNHKLKLEEPPNMIVTVGGRALDACSAASSPHHMETVAEIKQRLEGDVARWTMSGVEFLFMKDVPGQDMPSKHFMYLAQDRKSSLETCAKECWLNGLCRAFSYDRTEAQCWPKMRPATPVEKTSVIAGVVRLDVRSSRKDWAAMWGAKA